MQQSPQMFGTPLQQQQQQPINIISTEQIQKYLDENKQLIMAIMESQNLGKINECAQYQTQLQKNLMYLAAIADAQPPAPTPTGPSQPQPQAQQQQQLQQQQQQHPQSQPQMPMQSPMSQGSPMQPPQHGFAQQQQQQQQMAAAAYGGARMPFMSQPYDQQLHNIQQQQQQQQQQHQQSMAGMMGMRMGAPPGMHPSLQMGQGTPTHFMDARSRQDGSDANTGSGQGK